MGRAGKLYRRLDELEAELRGLILHDLERTAEGQIPAEDFVYLLRKAYPDAVCCAPSERCEWMLRADHEIVALRRKLGEPLPGPCLEIAEAFAQDLRSGNDAQGHGVSFKSLKRAVGFRRKEAARKLLREVRQAEEKA